MKRVFSIFLAAMLLFLPVTAFATEETPDVPSPSIKDETVPVIDPVPSNPDASIPEIDISDDGITPEQPNTENNSNEASNNPTDVTETSTDEVSSKESESEAAGTEDSDSSETTSEVTEESEDTSEEIEESEEHVHEFTYRSNGDGTHTVTCTAKVRVPSNDTEESEPVYEEVDCTYEEIESCTFDDDGKCIYCGYEEEKAFNPTISVEIEEQTCVIGKTNPLICLYISDATYDIAYAQICFANYTKNKYINVGLSRGKYYNDLIEQFIDTSDDGWYASPNITNDYSTGEYEIRSIYVRTTTNESIHYSLESDSLPEEFSSNSIIVNTPAESFVSNLFGRNTDKTVNSKNTIVDDRIEVPIIDDVMESAPAPQDNTEEEHPSKNIDDIYLSDEEIIEPLVEDSEETTKDTDGEAITEITDESTAEVIETATETNKTEIKETTNAAEVETSTETHKPEPAPESTISTTPTKTSTVSNGKSTQENKKTDSKIETNNSNNSSNRNIFSQIANFFKRLFRF